MNNLLVNQEDIAVKLTIKQKNALLEDFLVTAKVLENTLTSELISPNAIDYYFNNQYYDSLIFDVNRIINLQDILEILSFGVKQLSNMNKDNALSNLYIMIKKSTSFCRFQEFKKLIILAHHIIGCNLILKILTEKS